MPYLEYTYQNMFQVTFQTQKAIVKWLKSNKTNEFMANWL